MSAHFYIQSDLWRSDVTWSEAVSCKRRPLARVGMFAAQIRSRTFDHSFPRWKQSTYGVYILGEKKQGMTINPSARALSRWIYFTCRIDHYPYGQLLVISDYCPFMTRGSLCSVFSFAPYSVGRRACGVAQKLSTQLLWPAVASFRLLWSRRFDESFF